MFSDHFLGFVGDFFPDSVRLVRSLSSALGLDALSCPSLAEPPVLRVAGLDIRNPMLLPLQLAGILIGFYGALGRPGRPGALRWAALFFAAMNASSVACHNLMPRHGQGWQIARLVDIVLTGASGYSLCLLAAPGSSKPGLHPLVILAFLAGLNAFGDVHLHLGPRDVPFVGDATYLGGLLLAAIVLATRLATLGPRNSPWLLPAMVGLATVLVALPLDNGLCWLSRDGSPFRTTGLLWLFGGSDLAFLALANFVDIRRKRAEDSKDY